MSAGISILKDLVSAGSGGPATGGARSGSLSGDSSEAMIRQGELAALYQFWVEKKSSLGKIPSRADFSPQELTRLLPHIALVDVDHDSSIPEFTFRLCGTQIAEDSGVDLTGKTWSHFPNSSEVIKRAIKLTEDMQPYYATNIQAKWAPKNFHHYSVLALPLSKDGQQVDMILYGVMFHPFTSAA